MHLRTARFVSPFSDVLLSLRISFSLILSSRLEISSLSLSLSLSLSILVTDDSSSLSSAPCSSSIISLRPMRLYELEYTIHMRRALIYIYIYVCDLFARFICTGTHDRTHWRTHTNPHAQCLQSGRRL